MIEQPENQDNNILISNETPISLSGKTPKANLQNHQKNQVPTEKTQYISEKPINNNELECFKNNSTSSSLEQKYDNEKIGDNIINLSGKPKDSKDFIEKKRKRRNRSSYSCKRPKKSKSKITIPSYIDLSKKLEETPKSQIQDTPLNNPILSEYHSSSGAIKFDPNIEREREQMENNKTEKKRARISEKERIANEEKEFMDKLNQEYSDEQYNKDMSQILKEKKAQFMQKNFPIMYRKDKYYLYNILLNKRRKQPIHFINPKSLSSSLQESKKLQTLYLNEEPEKLENNSSENYEEDKIMKNSQKLNSENNTEEEQLALIKKNLTEKENENKDKKLLSSSSSQKSNNKKNNGVMSDTSPSEHDIKNLENTQSFCDNPDKISELKFKKLYNTLPKQVWSMPDEEKELDVDLFYDDCIQIWPFDECTFVKEIALEFLMKNDYSTDVCLKRLKSFVSFMKKRADELNISILNKNEKTVKNYSLRKTKNN